MLTTVVVVMGLGCGRSVSTDDASVRPDAGRDGGDGEFDAGRSCGALTSARDGGLEVAQVTALFTQLSTLRPTVEVLGGDLAFIQRARIEVSEPTAEATLALLATPPDSPLRQLRLVSELKSSGIGDSRTVVLRRAGPSVEAAWFAAPAIEAWLSRIADRWYLVGATVSLSVTFASDDEIQRLSDCSDSPASPAQGPYTFEGFRFVFCNATGTYSYASRDGDTTVWAFGFGQPDRPAWHWRGGRWRVLRPARFTVEPANYWPMAREADAWCGEVLGWEMLLDVVSGERVDVKPGLNCTTCLHEG